MAKHVIVNGEPVTIPDGQITENELRKLFDFPDGRPLVKRGQAGGTVYGPGTVIDVQDGDQFTHAPVREKGRR